VNTMKVKRKLEGVGPPPRRGGFSLGSVFAPLSSPPSGSLGGDIDGATEISTGGSRPSWGSVGAEVCTCLGGVGGWDPRPSFPGSRKDPKGVPRTWRRIVGGGDR